MSLRDKQALAYNKMSGETVVKIYCDGSFEINGKPSKDRFALAEAMIEWTLEYGKAQYKWVELPKTPCDCGAEKANTTHSGWCSVNQGIRP